MTIHAVSAVSSSMDFSYEYREKRKMQTHACIDNILDMRARGFPIEHIVHSVEKFMLEYPYCDYQLVAQCLFNIANVALTNFAVKLDRNLLGEAITRSIDHVDKLLIDYETTASGSIIWGFDSLANAYKLASANNIVTLIVKKTIQLIIDNLFDACTDYFSDDISKFRHFFQDDENVIYLKDNGFIFSFR